MLFGFNRVLQCSQKSKRHFFLNCFLKAWWPITLLTYLPLHLSTKEKNHFYAKKYSQFCHVDFDFTFQNKRK